MFAPTVTRAIFQPMKNLITETGIPHWLQPPKLGRGDHYHEWTWETILDKLAAGETLTAICRDVTMPEYGPLLKWIHAEEARKQRYYDARAIGMEAMGDQLLNIADGKNADGSDPVIEEDVQRSALKVSTRKWLMGTLNRDRYGDSKKVDVNVNVDISEAMKAAQERITTGKTIEGEIVDVGKIAHTQDG